MSDAESRRLGPIAVLVLLACLIGGCRGERRVMAPPTWGSPEAVVTSLQVSPVEFVAGEDISIEVTLHNPTKQPIVLAFSSGCILSFVVEDLQGNRVAPLDRVCTAEAPMIELSPGESITWRFDWNGAARQPDVYLPPGEYQVIGGLDAGALREPTTPVAVRILTP